ncbi:hypothetical protein B0H17DRAFT_1336399 [Mycena rosella]|uniref:CxC2-like cysteine cluster KDZ transposase-associated domain-containing protein n=1 Tax=Mycena rosella TaxID=1033263 RepID=A0AAD7CW09_MYCRO|nr:hypothetical protein B0H17DRAFT_1336399 [Mycena rosella]
MASQSHKHKTAKPKLTVGATATVVSSRSSDDRRDRPLKTWYASGFDQQDLEENLRREGRGSPKNYSKCCGVRCHDLRTECPNRKCTGVVEYRCVDQACVGEGMQCRECIVASHAQLPTHFVERWTGTHFKRKRAGLRDLGHPAGKRCLFGHAAAHDFVLYDLTGVHEVAVDFCGCATVDNGPPVPSRPQLMRVCWWPATVRAPNTCATFAVLRLFQILNCLGKLSAYDFLRGLEMCTNHDGLDKPPDRRKPFMHIMKQWRETKCHKQRKRGNKAGGTRATMQEGWEDTPAEYQFIYCLFLAMDANFRLSNRNVSSELADPIIGDGWGYFCKHEGQDGYKAHILKHAGQGTTDDGDQRGNMWCANGMGDLQMGERYCNMDFLLLAALMTFRLLWLIAPYNIACQFAINFFHRMVEFPEPMRLMLAPGNMWWKATLKDVFGFHNYDRQLAMLTTLREIQLAIAQEEFLCTDDRVEVEQEHLPGMFISMGLDLEEQQLEIDVKALKDPSPTQKLAFTKRRTAMLKRIHAFRTVQRVYMPALRAVLSDQQKRVFDGNGEQLPEATWLFMPSEIGDARVQGRACAIGLPEVEAWMREGEAGEALDGAQQGLRTRTMTNRYKLCNFTGQGMITKGQGILHLINVKIHMAKICYRYARAAVLVLRGHGVWEERLRVLNDDDVRALNERALTVEEKAQNDHWAELGRAIIEGGVARAAGVAASEGSHTLSWIWYTVGVTVDENNPRLHDALRVEWSKVYSRARRYDEDIWLLREEMCRTIASGVSEAAEWDALAREELPNTSLELMEGRHAYAAENAERERETCVLLQRNWAPILAHADRYLAGDVTADVGADVAVTLVLQLGDELDPEDDEARLEAEEEEGPEGITV